MKRHQASTAASVFRRPLVSVPIALGAVIALAAGASGSARAGTDQPATTARAAAAQPVRHLGSVPRSAPSRAGTWKLLPAAPVTKQPVFAVSAWTGREMIIHGLFPSVTFAYRPRTNKWAKLRPGPKGLSGLEADDVAVWTGSRMLVMGLTNGSYNPVANTWRAIARGAGPDQEAVVAWTGHQAIIWGGVCCAGSSNSGTAYDPKSNTWQVLPNAPLEPRRGAAGAWTGKELIVAGGGKTLTTRIFRDAAAYNPATHKWRTLRRMPAPREFASAVWDGNELLVVGGRRSVTSGTVVHGLAYNPATNRWRWLPAMPFPRSGFATVWTGRQLLIWGGLNVKGIAPPHGEAYNPATNRWAALPAAPLRGREGPIAVWTGRQMIVWGGGFVSGQSLIDGAAYTPAR
jgi:hypothetical protein